MRNINVNLFRNLVLVLLLLGLAIPGFTQFAGGNGTQNDPYLVATAEHLNAIRGYSYTYFKQIADINLGVAPYNTGEGWIPIGGSTNWWIRCEYDGNGFVISNLYINRPYNDYQGLFGYAYYPTYINMKLEQVNVSGRQYTGGLVGYCTNFPVFLDCYVSGIVAGAWSSAGGMAGRIYEDGSVIRCKSTCTVNGHDNTGGLIGSVFETDVTQCMSQGIVNSTGSYVGGLIGSGHTIGLANSFSAAGSVTGTSYTGGLVGFLSNSSFGRCYAAKALSGQDHTGGLIGDFVGGINYGESYWDTEVSGLTTSACGEGRTTVEMTYPHATNTYINWAFDDVWRADISGLLNNGYPYLHGVEITGNSDLFYPTTICTSSCYPNPFSESAFLNITLEKITELHIDIYNLKGQKVRTLAKTLLGKGEHTISWDGKTDGGIEVPNGIYLCRFKGTNFPFTLKLTVLR